MPAIATDSEHRMTSPTEESDSNTCRNYSANNKSIDRIGMQQLAMLLYLSYLTMTMLSAL